MNILQEAIKDIKFRRQEPRYREIKGFKMWINTKEPSYTIRKTLRYYDEVEAHEPETTKIIEKITNPGDVMVDIGANIGYFSLLAGKLGAIVHAFEPEPKNYIYLENNIQGYQITPYNVAISNKNGREKLYLCHYDSGHHTIQQDKGIKEYRNTSLIRKIIDIPKVKTIEISARTLDSFDLGKVDIIKLDCEGSEGIALEGMEVTLRKNPQAKLIIEFFPLLLEKMGYSPRELIARLQDKGYIIQVIGTDYDSPGQKEIRNYDQLSEYMIKEVDSHVNLYAFKS